MNEKIVEKYYHPDQPPEWINRAEAARVLGVTPAQMRLYLVAGKFLSAHMLRGTRWRVDLHEVERAVDENWTFAGPVKSGRPRGSKKTK